MKLTILYFLCFFMVNETINGQVCIGESIPEGNGSSQVSIPYILNSSDPVWDYYNMYNHEVYSFTVDQSGQYTFSNAGGGGFLCLLEGYDPTIDFYSPPNNLTFQTQTEGESFSINLTAETDYVILLKSRFGDESGTAIVSGPGNITLECDFAPIPTLSQWGIIALGMLTMIFGVVMIRQRKTIFA